jgi:hypothetical protein
MERKKLLTHIILPAAIGGLFLFFISEPGVTLLFALSTRDSPSDISDPELINRTKDLSEVKAFLTHYPNATTYVDPLDDFSVVYNIRECQVKNQRCIEYPSTLERYNELRVRLDSNGNPLSSELICNHDFNGEQKTIKIRNDFFRKDAVIEFLDKDVCIFW